MVRIVLEMKILLRDILCWWSSGNRFPHYIEFCCLRYCVQRFSTTVDLFKFFLAEDPSAGDSWAGGGPLTRKTPGLLARIQLARSPSVALMIDLMTASFCALANGARGRASCGLPYPFPGLVSRDSWRPGLRNCAGLRDTWWQLGSRSLRWQYGTRCAV